MTTQLSSDIQALITLGRACARFGLRSEFETGKLASGNRATVAASDLLQLTTTFGRIVRSPLGENTVLGAADALDVVVARLNEAQPRIL